jgi:sulfur carrier protein ThiS
MRIQAKLFATLTKLVPDRIRDCYPQSARAGSRMDIELPEGSTLADLVDHLGLPQEKVRVIFVNGLVRPRDYVLAPQDDVGIFPPIGGG